MRGRGEKLNPTFDFLSSSLISLSAASASNETMETWAERRKEILIALSQLATTLSNPAESDSDQLELFLHQSVLRCIQLETARKGIKYSSIPLRYPY